MQGFETETYNYFFEFLQGEDPELAAQFASFFSEGTGGYICNDVTGYTAWVNENIGDGADELGFFDWATIVTGISGQNSGTLPE